MTALAVRSAELAEVVRCVLHGRGAVVVGAAGVGKTALASAAVEQVGTAVGTVVWTTATAAARLTPFGALAPLLPAEMSTVHPALVPNLVARRLAELAGDRPALLVVDDAQLLDEHSAAALLPLVTGRACRVLATVRTDAPASDAVVALWKDRLLDRLDLEPLDRAGVRAVLVDRLGGEVATGTVEMLWEHSQGNPLYLSKLARFGVDTGRLRREAGVWWWSGEPGMPPRLGELFARRLDELSAPARDALDLLALGEPLPWATLAESRLTPARRRALGERLRRAPGRQPDVVRRAGWEATADRPDVGVLLAAADAVLLSDPRAAVRFAERALPHDPGPDAAFALAAAHAEVGDPAAARAALEVATERARGPADRLRIGFENISLSLWHDRRPDRAAAYLAALRATSGPDQADQIDSAEAQVVLFGARPADALRRAGAVLARDPAPVPTIRALTVRMTALTPADEPRAALVTAAELLAAMEDDPPIATRAGLAHALIAMTGRTSARPVRSARPGGGRPRARAAGRRSGRCWRASGGTWRGCGPRRWRRCGRRTCSSGPGRACSGPRRWPGWSSCWPSPARWTTRPRCSTTRRRTGSR